MAKRTWFSMAAKDAGKTAEITIYDLVGYWGVDAISFYNELQALGDQVETINLRINSPGGDVYQGVAIHNMLARHTANVVVTVDGLAASIASLIMMAGNEIVMPENSAVLIHNPSGGVFGTADDMDEMADWLRKIGQGVTNTYVTSNRKNLPRADIEAMLAAETWLTAQEAVDKGFADRVVDPRDITAKFDLEALGFHKAPRALMLGAIPAQWQANAASVITGYRRDAVASFEPSGAGAAILAAEPDPVKARAGFLIFDQAAPALTASFGLPIATPVDGKLLVTAEALDAAALSLAEDGREIPPEVKASAEAAIAEHRRALAILKENAPTPHVRIEGPNAVEAARQKEILAACELANVTAKQAREFIDGGKTLDEVRAELQRLAAGAGGPGRSGELNPHNSGDDKPDAKAAQAGWQKAIDRHNAARMQHARRA